MNVDETVVAWRDGGADKVRHVRGLVRGHHGMRPNSLALATTSTHLWHCDVQMWFAPGFSDPNKCQ